MSPSMSVAQLLASNALLAALGPVERRGLLPGLEFATLKFGEVLHQPGLPIRHVYFPIDCVVSLSMPVARNQPLEICQIGNEGMVGSPLVLGFNESPRQAAVQAPGIALRMESGIFRKQILHSKRLQQTLFRYKHALIGQIAQSAVCSQYHSVQARLARYLLTTSDRAKSKDFHFTQEYLADRQGVRRSAITIAANALRKRGLIEYNRGKITIVDRRRLTAASCECYQIIKHIYSSAFALV